MINEPVEKLKELLAKKEKSISEKESQVQRLEMEISEEKHEVAGVHEAIRFLSNGSNVNLLPQVATTPALPSIGKYRSMKPTPAVLDVIQVHGNPPGLLVPEIIIKLKEEGFKSNAKELYATIYAMAQRLVKQEKIKEGTKDGKRTFMRKQPF